MKRVLACLALGMALTAAWAQSRTSLTVEYTFQGSYVDLAAQKDGQTFVTPSLFRRFGWKVDVDNGLMTVLAEGKTFELESKIFGDSRLYCLEDALRFIGGASVTDVQTGAIKVVGQVRIIERTATGLRIDSTLTVKPRAFKLAGPDRLVIDLEGAILPDSVSTGLPQGWRASQTGPTTVRVVVEQPSMAAQPVPVVAQGRTVEIALRGVVALPPPPTAKVGTPTPGGETNDSVTVSIPFTGNLSRSPSAVFIDPTTVQVALPGTTAESSGQVELQGTKLIKGLEVYSDDQGTSTVTVKLGRAMAFQLSPTTGGVIVKFNRPRVAGGLAGKVIVVDAGHGGKDSGATHGGVQEKHMALAMAHAVARELALAGASVILSRSDDTFISLNERPGLANRSQADLFISCHFNSNSVDDSRSGTIMFYHKGDSMDQLLAECIRNKVAKVSGLPDLGAWSDGKIYSSGFAVLRSANMPAVLMELGFLNHSGDRARIQKQSFRDRVAEAVVEGVKEFLGDGK